MSTQQKALPVRVSAPLRALVDRAGPVSAATRALLILGAHAVGYDLTALRHEIAALLLRGELDTPVLDALAGLAVPRAHPGAIAGDSTGAGAGASQGASAGENQGDSTGASAGESQSAITLPDAPIALDPFATIGIDV